MILGCVIHAKNARPLWNITSVTALTSLPVHSQRLARQCTGNEVKAVADVVFHKGLVFLACMIQPSIMLWTAYLGISTIDALLPTTEL